MSNLWFNYKKSSVFRLFAFIILATVVLASGCTSQVRQTVKRPFIDEPVSVETIFGEATIGDDRSEQAIADIKVPDLPHEGALTLDECLALARKVSPALDTADQAYLGAMWSRWQAITAFLPTTSVSYGVSRQDDPLSATSGRDLYSWGTQVSQPIFTGGRNLTTYLLSQLGLEAADIQKAQAKEELLLAVKQAFFSILASEKALAVAKTAVINLSSHLNVARNFYDVDMVPQSQVLEAEVELAKAQQEETNQNRNLIVNTARLNILLRRAVDFPIKIKDELQHPRFPLTLEECLRISLRFNPEMRLGRNQVESGAKNVDLAKADLYPQILVTYNNNSSGNTARAHGGWGPDASSWNIAAVASFNIWEWGRTQANVEKSKVELNQAINSLTSLEDNTKLELTTNYQNLVSAGRNISVAAKAVEAAAEDLRMVSERYQEQVATNTDVLDAQTRYSEAQYEYFQSLYNYNLSWAAIERTMGRRVTPAGLVEEPTNSSSVEEPTNPQ
jgi:outer membrane protein TolC